jgi:hypothetical protein
MSDSSVNQFLSQADDTAARTGFVPAPPTPAADLPNGYLCFQRDTGALYAWNSDTAAWVLITSGTGTLPATVQGDMLYATAANTIAALAKNASATRYLSNTGATNNPAWAQIDLTTGVTGDLPFANLAQGSALSVLGVTGNATADNASIAAASDHQVMRRSGTAVAFGAVNVGQSAAITGVLPVANGGTGLATAGNLLSSATVTINNADIIAMHTSSPVLVAAPGAGFRLVLHEVVVQTNFIAGYTNISASAFLALNYSGGTEISNYLFNDAGLSETGFTTVFSTNPVSSFIFREWMRAYDPTNGDDWGNAVFPKASKFDNESIVLNMENGSNLTGGNAGNQIVVTTYYTTVATV